MDLRPDHRQTGRGRPANRREPAREALASAETPSRSRSSQRCILDPTWRAWSHTCSTDPLGETFADDERSLALIWGMAHQAAIAQPDAVARAGFDGQGVTPREQLFDAGTRTETGVRFSDDRYSDAWDYVQPPIDGSTWRSPICWRNSPAFATSNRPVPASEFPFIPSAGERREFHRERHHQGSGLASPRPRRCAADQSRRCLGSRSGDRRRGAVVVDGGGIRAHRRGGGRT